MDVARAAWRVIVRDGLHEASVRAIAKELKATTGVVTYHFRDKEDLMLFALDRLSQSIEDAIDHQMRGAVGPDRLLRLLEATLPVGPRQAQGWRIWFVFTGYALAHPRLMEEHRRRLDRLRQRIATELSALRKVGAVAGTVKPLKEADAIVALGDGIGLSHLLRPELYPPARQREIMWTYLGPLLRRKGRDSPKSGRA